MGFIWTVIAIVGLLATLGYTGYLWQLDRVAQQRAGGEATRVRVKKRMPVALGSTGVALLGTLLTNGSLGMDIVGIILAGGAGLYSAGQLKQANRQL